MSTPAPWERRRRLFAPQGQKPWLQSHAAVPFAVSLGGDVFRVYFSARDSVGRSQVAWAVVDIERPGDLLDLSDEPLFGPGELGAFDDSGAMLSWIVERDGQTALWYYIGWNLGVTVPFRNSIGLAEAGLEGVRRLYRGPILDRTRDEPHFTASCCVLPGDPVWRMYYLACVGWDTVGGRPRHRYHIRYAESRNGIDWVRNGVVAIDFASPNEYAISRPTVLARDRWLSMWFSSRGDRYCIAHATSADGIVWKRTAHGGMAAGPADWESQMVCYPHVVKHGDRELMFYNGNDYGASGFGVAEREAASP